MAQGGLFVRGGNAVFEGFEDRWEGDAVQAEHLDKLDGFRAARVAFLAEPGLADNVRVFDVVAASAGADLRLVDVVLQLLLALDGFEAFDLRFQSCDFTVFCGIGRAGAIGALDKLYLFAGQ